MYVTAVDRCRAHDTLCRIGSPVCCLDVIDALLLRVPLGRPDTKGDSDEESGPGRRGDPRVGDP